MNKNATDGQINGWKHSHKGAQALWRQTHRVNCQVLRGGGKPSDQTETIPNALPANPNVDARIDVYEGPTGKGWVATFFAEENDNSKWFRTVSSHEDGALVETDWAPVPEEIA